MEHAQLRVLKSIDPKMMVGNMTVGWIVESLQNNQNLQYIVDNLPQISSADHQSRLGGELSKNGFLSIAVVASAVIAVIYSMVYPAKSIESPESHEFEDCIADIKKKTLSNNNALDEEHKKAIHDLYKPWHIEREKNLDANGKLQEPHLGILDSKLEKLEKQGEALYDEHWKRKDLGVDEYSNNLHACYTNHNLPYSDKHQVLKKHRDVYPLTYSGGVSTLHRGFVIIILLIVMFVVVLCYEFQECCIGEYGM